MFAFVHRSSLVRDWQYLSVIRHFSLQGNNFAEKEIYYLIKLINETLEIKRIQQEREVTINRRHIAQVKLFRDMQLLKYLFQSGKLDFMSISSGNKCYTNELIDRFLGVHSVGDRS